MEIWNILFRKIMRAASPWPDSAFNTRMPQPSPRTVAEVEGFVNRLLDDAIAEKAYEVIFKCKRGEKL
jgi:hypothetical protein